ncbi:hypothetical protein RDI58_007657 [Solanum bulbocastanum]|uniref:Uncharacterized protein n=1 Tax=Solanum bulbocastanum TaxID=147425 RepID=A0AAN8TVL0_SOLBU
MDYSCDDIDGLLNDQFRDVSQAEGVYDGSNKDAKKYYNLVEEARITSLKEEINEMREEMRHFFSQLLQNNPGLNVRDMPGCVRSNIASPIDASSAQAVKGQNLPHSSGLTHDLQKDDFVGLSLSSLVVN